MGRPKGRSDVSQMVGLSPDTADWVCILAIRRQTSVRKFLGNIVEVVFREYKTLESDPAWYGAPQRHSTLAQLFQAVSSSGMRAVAVQKQCSTFGIMR